MPECPKCGKNLKRVHRKLTDKLIGVVVSVTRYRCQSHNCDWEGLLRNRSKPLYWTPLIWIAVILGAIFLGQLIVKMGR